MTEAQENEEADADEEATEEKKEEAKGCGEEVGMGGGGCVGMSENGNDSATEGTDGVKDSAEVFSTVLRVAEAFRLSERARGKTGEMMEVDATIEGMDSCSSESG